MDDKPPILDYETPGAIQEKKPLAVRIVYAVLAAFATLYAADFLSVIFVGLYDAIYLQGWRFYELLFAGEIFDLVYVFSIELLLLVIAFSLWKQVGLHFLPRRRKHDER